MLQREIIEEFVREDFEKLDFADQPMEFYGSYFKKHHIDMATRLVEQAFSHRTVYMLSEVEDFIHGLNHIFFYGVAAGQSFEITREMRE